MACSYIFSIHPQPSSHQVFHTSSTQIVAEVVEVVQDLGGFTMAPVFS